MEIIIAKLISGDIVVGKRNGDYIDCCVGLRVIQKSPSQIETHLMPMLHPFSDEFINVEIKNVIYYAPTNKELSDQYIQATSNIIISPKTNLANISSSNITPFTPRRK